LAVIDFVRVQSELKLLLKVEGVRALLSHIAGDANDRRVARLVFAL